MSHSDGRDQFTIGDAVVPLVVVIADADGRARDMTTYSSVRVFVEGETSGHRPGTLVTSAVAAVTTNGSATITRASGSFVTDGFVVGMLLYGTGIPAGAVVQSVVALTIVMASPALATASGTIALTGWFGVNAPITAAPTGEATVAAWGTYLNIGVLESDVYRGKCRVVNGSGAVGWTNNGIDHLEFLAVQPGAGP